MTVQDLEQQLLQLNPSEKLRIIQLLLQSLSGLWSAVVAPPPKASFMRFAGIAGDETHLLTDLEAGIERDRALDNQRHLDL